ncbi:unnamed protein product [Cercospora beticola]|nr:unnamed protein product [Cercospora beticola]
MSKPKLLWGLSIQQLESIADSTPYMTVAELVEKVHQVAGDDDSNDETSNREIFQIVSVSEIQDAESVLQPKVPSQQPTQPSRAAKSAAQDPSSNNVKDIPVPTPGSYSAYAAAELSEASAITPSGQDHLQSLYPPMTTIGTSSQSAAATSAANSGDFLPNSVAPTYGVSSFTNSTPGVSQYFPQQPVLASGPHTGARQSLFPQDHHASLESYGHMNAENLLAQGNGIDISQIFGGLILRIALEKMPESKVTKMLNDKRAVDRPSAREIRSTKTFRKRVENAIRHIFGAFDDASYKAHRSTFNAAQNDPVLRTEYIAMLQDRKTFLINPRSRCERCTKNKDMTESKSNQSVTGQLQQSSPQLYGGVHTGSSFPALSAVPSSWTIESMLNPPTPAAPAQSMPAPRRKRPATASNTQAIHPASKRRQGAGYGADQTSQLPQPDSTSETYAMPPQHSHQSEANERNETSERTQSQYPADESTLANGLLDFLHPPSQSTFEVGSWMQESTVPASSPPVPRYTSYHNDRSNVDIPPSSPPVPRYTYYHENAGNMGSAINSDAAAAMGVTTSAYGRSDGYLISDAPGDAVQQLGSDGTFSQWQPPQQSTLGSDFWGNEMPADEGAERRLERSHRKPNRGQQKEQEASGRR